MKKLIIIAFLFHFAFVHAQISKTVNISAGELKTTIPDSIAINITELTIEGTMDARDFQYFQVHFKKIVKIDLSKVNIVEYEGADGTGVGYYFTAKNIKYKSDVLPTLAFHQAWRTLRKIVLPESLLKIDIKAFESCSNIDSLIVPEYVYQIKEYAFENCKKLKYIYLPKYTQIIGKNAFEACPAEVVVHPDNPIYFSQNKSLFNSNDSILIKCAANFTGSYEIPDFVRAIENGAFQDCVDLKLVHFSRSVRDISDFAFAGCSNLERINIPFNVMHIGRSAFAGCKSLQQVVVNAQVDKLPSYCFSGCTSLKSVTLNEKLKIIGDGTFISCKSLKKIEIPESVESIYFYTFSKCDSLESITIHKNVKNIGERAFAYCPNLKTVQIQSALTSLSSGLFLDCPKLTNFKIPESVHTLGSGVFDFCTSLGELKISASVDTIESPSFYECNTYLIVDAYNKKYKSINGVLYSKDLKTIYKCPPSKEGRFEIFSGTETISENAFLNCNKLTEIVFPKSVKKVEKAAFMNCTGIEKLITYNPVPIDFEEKTGVFYNIESTKCKLYVPKGSKDAYRKKRFWNKYEIIEM